MGCGGPLHIHMSVLHLPVGNPHAAPFVLLPACLPACLLQVTKLFTGDFSDQRGLSQDVLVKVFNAALAGAGTDGVIDRGMEEVSVAKQPSKAELEELAAGAQDMPAEGACVPLLPKAVAPEGAVAPGLQRI